MREGRGRALLELLDQTCLARGVRYLDELGLRIQDVDELRALRHREGLVELQISAFVESRFVATLFDLEAELVSVHGLRESFDELRLGPLLQQPLVGSKFLPDPALRTIPQLSLGDVLKGLHRYRTETKNFKNVELVAFLNWLAAKRGASSPRSLCVAVNKYAIGSMIKFSGKAGRDQPREKACGSSWTSKAEYKAELKAQEAASKGAVRTAAVLSTAARDLAADAAGWAATDRFEVLVVNLVGDVQVAGKKKASAKKVAAMAELAACYALTLVGTGVDVEASRRTIEEARGLGRGSVARAEPRPRQRRRRPPVRRGGAGRGGGARRAAQVPSSTPSAAAASGLRGPRAGGGSLARTVCKRSPARRRGRRGKGAGGRRRGARGAHAGAEKSSPRRRTPLHALAALEAALIARAGADAFAAAPSLPGWRRTRTRASGRFSEAAAAAGPRLHGLGRVATAAATLGPDVLAGDGAGAALAARAGGRLGGSRVRCRRRRVRRAVRCRRGPGPRARH